ncbi:ThuA domain-containing protein [Candidatus Hydrogenedentota bacterium]
MKKALIVWGGWKGHEPEEVAAIFAEGLRERDFEVEVSTTLDSYKDQAFLETLDLIVPVWTMGEIQKEQLEALLMAVQSGTAIAGVHGGMGDSFRLACPYQHMVGGQWVAHPGGAEVTYEVNIVDHEHEITKGLKDFEITSEQYYMHVDPGNHVLATTNFGDVVMPVAWTKMWGEGRVYYCSLGHIAKDMRLPEAFELVMRGMMWAASS